MKKLILIFIFFSITKQFFGQIKKDSVIFLRSNSSLIYNEIDSDRCYTNNYNTKYKKGDMLFVTDVYDCNRYSSHKKIVEVYYDGKPRYLEYENKDDIFLVGEKQKTVLQVQDFFKNISKADKDSLSKFSKIFSEVSMQKMKNDYLESFLSDTKYTVGIIDAYPVEQYSFTGAKFKIVNYSKKTIKYITFNFYGKNAVKDKVGGTLSRKGIGPVEQFAEGEWNFESVWLTDIIDTLKLVSVNIIYMDGSSKNLPITTNNWVLDDEYERMKTLFED